MYARVSVYKRESLREREPGKWDNYTTLEETEQGLS